MTHPKTQTADLSLHSEVNHTGLCTTYPDDFVVTPDYKSSLPDLQNGPASLIKGLNAPIHHVGISNFRLPLRFATGDGQTMVLETSVTGTVSLEANKKGINMSRIMRSFYAKADTLFGFDALTETIKSYKADLDSLDARIQLRLAYPQKRRSLRSGLEGYQYYDVAMELVAQGDALHRVLHVDYVYSSTCPCSLELSEHARTHRGQLATPHAQRSIARLSLLLWEGADIAIDDILALCRTAVPTETQVMVKREDEQAFAELNAANPIFVEDAVRLFAEQVSTCDRIADFRVIASHQESLHSHDAVSLLIGGNGYFTADIGPDLFSALAC